MFKTILALYLSSVVITLDESFNIIIENLVLIYHFSRSIIFNHKLNRSNKSIASIFGNNSNQQ